MSTFLKPLSALLISVLIFAGLSFLADKELLNFIQTRFYNPSVVKSYVKENKIDAQLVQDHIIELQDRFAETLKEQAIRSSFLYNQSANDIYERSRIYGILLESISGLQSVQFIDTNGLRIHFSTSTRDIISQNRDSTSYRNYNEDPLALPYEIVSVPDGSLPKYIMDEQGERVIFAYPFFDSMDVYRGTALFNIGIRTLAERLIAEGRLKVSDDIAVVGEPPGILLGSPEVSKADIRKLASEVWQEGVQDRVTFDSQGSGTNYSLISAKTNGSREGIFFGRLINDYLFSISEPMKLILNLSMFLTFFLTLFFLINLKPNPSAVVRNRLKRLKASLFNQLYVNKSGQERARWILELEQRRDEIRSELKHNLKLSSRMEAGINNIIDNSWDELLAIIKVGSGAVIVQTKTVEKIVESRQSDDSDAQALEEIDDIEEIEDVDAIEEAEEAEGIDEISEAEEFEEVEEIDEIEEIGDAEEVNIIDVALREAIVPVQPYSVGLLQMATRFLMRKTSPVSYKKGLLKKASVYKLSDKGLFAKASAANKAIDESKKPKRKGLLALASEVEINQDYPVNDEVQDLIVEIDVVSPFSNMFSSLDNIATDE